MLTAQTRVHYGFTCLLKDLWICPWLSLWTTAYWRIQYVFSGCLIILATTSTSLSLGMASYAPVTSACGIHVSTTKCGWVQGQGVLLVLSLVPAFQLAFSKPAGDREVPGRDTPCSSTHRTKDTGA